MSFHCEKPDFVVRSIPDDLEFKVQRSCLVAGSEVFRDMFSCCEMGLNSVTPNNMSDQVLELDETAQVLAVLLRLLHLPFPSDERGRFNGIGSASIPLPLLPPLFKLADKYLLSEPLVWTLHHHLLAQAQDFPLQVYGYAAQLGVHHIAVEASRYLLHPPLPSYTAEEISVIPNVEAYHRLSQLHALRIERLREVLLGEDLFPHGYRACPSHRDRAVALFEQRKMNLACRIEPATDVAAEMAILSGIFKSCQTCHRACTAAVEMLAYKCQKIPKTIE